MALHQRLAALLTRIRWLVLGLVIGLMAGISYNATAQGSPYNPLLDNNHDGSITAQDIQTVAGAWNTTGDPSLVNLVARSYYLTNSLYAANAAPAACISGYHMASLAEIVNPAALRYASELSVANTTNDAGEGPPFNNLGWVRTGFLSSTGTIPGSANCGVWTTTASNANGTVVGLHPDWSASSTSISPWTTFIRTCNLTSRVWCVQD